ncbi:MULTISPECIES: MarR family winged helix-turn-helix transcriptional regulator [unclassified Sporosarcina]|uniref:MarR family winged helix-turn-helix transcriptional regulator n=1 Tax=unclassified Sporosarcina TaxID=2647733 RepID=UPI000C164DE5|nr:MULTISPECIES: MarR family transcriptional regulator [unclassified Sporosarcina]PIC98080.1 MarR family transcriptional regulator [Sporosarcina sp. P29]PID04830.1 MarR family transcriptional regulator [Sporosarcina sp. P30]PID08072.1 MarR family transcriptional regulator [Sporosarcina sp. P31]PID11170.1 MarR family transcriptional regulator [Sporosarcina sp. P32b]
MKDQLQEAVELFEEVMIYGTEHVVKNLDVPIWKDYSPEQIQVLKILSAYGHLSSGQLAEIQGVHKSAISTRLKKLVEKDLVQSEKDLNDQRINRISLTAKGHEVLSVSNAAINESIENLFTDQIDEQELEQFIKTFRKLKSILVTKER